MIPEFRFPLSNERTARLLHRTHYVQFPIACLTFILFIARLILRTQGKGIDPANPTAGGGASSGWGTGVAVKSIIFIGYQLATEFPKFQRWGSLKTNMVFNIIEVPFWWAVIGLTAGGLGSCIAPMCGLNAVILVLCLFMGIVAIPVAYASMVLFQQHRRGNYPTQRANHPATKNVSYA